MRTIGPFLTTLSFLAIGACGSSGAGADGGGGSGGNSSNAPIDASDASHAKAGSDVDTSEACVSAGGRCISAGSICLGLTPPALKNTCGNPDLLVCCAPVIPELDASSPHIDASPELGLPGNACAVAGGTCIGAATDCPVPVDPSLNGSCGNSSVAKCCVPLPAVDAGKDLSADSSRVACATAGGNCESTASIACPHGEIANATCGRDDAMCCAL